MQDKSFEDNENLKHSEENLPTTSTCGKCEYNSDDEHELKEHIQLVHPPEIFKCDLCSFTANHADDLAMHRSSDHLHKCTNCDFHTQSEESLNLHIKEKHTFLCDFCLLTSINERKHNIHTCRVYIENPTYKTFYTKEWLNRNGCSALYCSDLNRDVVWLHSSKCWRKEHPCYFAPYTLKEEEFEPGHLDHPEFS